MINYILISCSSILARKYILPKRKLLGAFLGTIYSLFYIYISFDFLFTIPSKIIIMTIITLCCFGFSSLEEFIKVSVVFYVVNIFISGSTFFVMYFTGTSNSKISFIIACAYFSCELLKYIYNEAKNINYMENIKQNITINLFDKNLDCKALLDSGNLLKDPFSNNDVVVVKPSLLKDIIPSEILNLKDINNIYNILDNFDKNITSKIKLIPYKDITNNKNCFIVGIKANYLLVDNKKIGNIVLGISDFDECEYEAILNPSVIN